MYVSFIDCNKLQKSIHKYRNYKYKIRLANLNKKDKKYGHTILRVLGGRYSEEVTFSMHCLTFSVYILCLVRILLHSS